ncbi:hypothetical protein DL96DRAFT_1580347 [Flagelloscypha sp. PMI_526]|nr:hypothetical protein DL96DRAFT_1580347 [Flagelloscypha sp. PMI_526]
MTSSSSSAHPKSLLPPELIHRIFSHFRPNRRGDIETLRNLALSHSSLRPIAQAVGWSSIHLRPHVKELLIGNGALTDRHTADVLSQLPSVEKLKIQVPLTTRKTPDEDVNDWVEVFPQVVSALTRYTFQTITSLWLDTVEDFHYQLLIHCPRLEELVLEGTDHCFDFEDDDRDSVNARAVEGVPPLKKLRFIGSEAPISPSGGDTPFFWLIEHTVSTLKEMAFVHPLSENGSTEKYIFGIVGSTLTKLSLSSSCFASRDSWRPTVLRDVFRLKNFPNLHTLALECNSPFDNSTVKMIRWLLPNISVARHLPFRNLDLSFLAGYPPLAPDTNESDGSKILQLWSTLDQKIAPSIEEVKICAEYLGTIGNKNEAWELQRKCLEVLLQTLKKREGVLVFEEKLSEDLGVGANNPVRYADDSD